jgi:hypothetical protein
MIGGRFLWQRGLISFAPADHFSGGSFSFPSPALQSMISNQWSQGEPPPVIRLTLMALRGRSISRGITRRRLSTCESLGMPFCPFTPSYFLPSRAEITQLER